MCECECVWVHTHTHILHYVWGQGTTCGISLSTFTQVPGITVSALHLGFYPLSYVTTLYVFSFFLFERGFYYVTLAGLELTKACTTRQISTRLLNDSHSNWGETYCQCHLSFHSPKEHFSKKVLVICISFEILFVERKLRIICPIHLPIYLVR